MADLSPDVVERAYAEQFAQKREKFLAAMQDLARSMGLVVQGQLQVLPAFVVGPTPGAGGAVDGLPSP